MFSQKISIRNTAGINPFRRVGRPRAKSIRILELVNRTQSPSLREAANPLYLCLLGPSLPFSYSNTAIALHAKCSISISQIQESLMFVTINEAARDYLHVSRSTVYRLAQQGAIQIVHIRGCARVPIKSINEYFQSVCEVY